MPGDMRFCRSCGQRLGEGSAEYTETVLLGQAPTAAGGRFTTQFGPGVNAPMTHQTGGSFAPRRRRLGFSGMTWMWISLGIFFASGGLMSAVVKNVPRAARTSAFATSNRSYLGVKGVTSANGGATFDASTPPGGPADKAGLVGGDIVTSFDGHPVKNDDDMTAALSATPIGKTVEMLYLRDGEPKTTQLTTISNDELDQLDHAFGARAEGKGLFGYEDSGAKRVLVPDTKTYGVRLDDISSNGPADIAGIKEGDIVMEFGGTPIRTSAELLSRVRRAIPRSTVEVVVMRDGQRVMIPVKMGKA